MRVRVIVATLMATAGLAGGCGTSPKPAAVPSASADSAAGGSSGVTMPSPSQGAAVLGTVDTNGSGCDATAKRGDCWLPLYNGPALQGTVLNATTKPTKDKCQVKGDESGCWPQPGDKVKVICTAIGADGVTYYGMDVPADKQLTKDPTETKRDKLGGVLGYNRTQWVKLPGYAATPPSCGSL